MERKEEGAWRLADYGSFEYGGVRFVRMVPQDEITRYIASLSDEKKGDVQEIVMSLEAAGLLSIEATEESEKAGAAQAGPAQSGPVIVETPPPTGVYLSQGTVYAMTPDGAKAIPDNPGNRERSYYDGQPPAPPQPGSISAALRVDPSFIRRGEAR